MQRCHPSPRRTARTTPASLLEALEPRVHLAAFAYQSLADYLDLAGPAHVLRPLGENRSEQTISSSVAAAGDVDGDGFADILVGAGGRNNAGSDPIRAMAVVYSGRTGGTLLTFNDGFTEFGAAVAGIGDVNGDGRPDLLVGSPRWDDDGAGGNDREQGRAYIYSGADGALLFTLTGEADGDRFGEAVAAAGDVNGDGTPDVIVGAPGRDQGGDDRAGRASIFSGADGSVLRTLTGIDPRSRFGAAVAGAGDLDGDGDADVLVGAPGTTTGGIQAPGNVYVFAGADGSTLLTLTGTQDRDEFGFAVAGGADLSGDGTPDIIVGAPSWDGPDSGGGATPDAGRVRVFSGADGSVLATLNGTRPSANYGAAVAFAGDADLDGRQDFLVGEPSADPQARVVVYSGDDDNAELARFIAGESGLIGSDRLGTAVAALGDADGDGFGDFAFAGTKDANPGRGDRARFYVFSGVGAAALRPRGINDEGVIWGDVGNGAGNTRSWMVVDGRVRLVSTIDGFEDDDRIIDVNNGGVVLGSDAGTGDAFTWAAGDRVLLADRIMTFDGPAGMFTGLTPVDLTDSGLILVGRQSDAPVSTAWLFDTDTLRYLFDGIPVAMNEAGVVVGVDSGAVAFGGGPPLMVTTTRWTPDGGATTIENFQAIDINEGGVVLGRIHPDGANGLRGATWLDGTLTPLPAPDGVVDVVPGAIDDAGRVIGLLRSGPPGESVFASFFFDADEGIFDIAEIVPGAPPEFTSSGSIALSDINNDGLIVGFTSDTRAAFVLTPTEGTGPAAGEIGGRVDATLPGSSELSVVTVNAAGEVIVFRRDPATGLWTAVDLDQAAGAPAAVEAVTFTDPRTGRAFYAFAAADGLYVATQLPGGQWSVTNITTAISPARPIARGLTVFTTLDGIVYLAGIDADGNLVAHSQNLDVLDENGLPRWNHAHLTNQLIGNGAVVPSFQGRLISYVTSWNGLNIAGLDENGDIWTVWTSPELSGQWTSSNLSEITDTPSLRGGLTPYLTPWGGINLAGVDDQGETVVTWWVPQFGGDWARNNFTREFGFSRFRPESVSSFVTPWGGLNITGLNEQGEVIVYWWAPATGQWAEAALEVANPGEDRGNRPLRRVDGYAAPDGSMSLLGVGRGGSVLRLHWRPDQPWLFENLTERVRG